MALCIMKFDSSLCDLFVDTYSNVSDACKTEILESDSIIPTTLPFKQS